MLARLTGVFLFLAAFPAAAAERVSPVSGFAPVVRDALVTGMIYSFAVQRNGDGYCLPANDAGVDVIWKEVAERQDLFSDVELTPNKLPEGAYLKVLRGLFPCRQ